MTTRSAAYYNSTRNQFQPDDSAGDEHAKGTGILEALVDRFTLPVILSWLADVCNDKADHIRENWQDEIAAKAWEKYSIECTRAAVKI